jgi:hypothetical protein
MSDFVCHTLGHATYFKTYCTFLKNLLFIAQGDYSTDQLEYLHRVRENQIVSLEPSMQ